jgi:hypothetical protein
MNELIVGFVCVLLAAYLFCTQTVVTGQLLGLDVDGRLEITHCFPLPSAEGEESSESMSQLMTRPLPSH